jgi:hypothetical protein
MPISTKMWLRKGCDKIHTKKTAHTSRPDDPHRWQFVWAQNGMAVSGGGMPYGEIDTDYSDGWHNVGTLPLALPDRPFEQFHIIRKKYDEAMSTPFWTSIDLDTLIVSECATHLRLNTDESIEISSDRLKHIIAGIGGRATIHTPDNDIYWITNGKRFALLGFA